MPTRRTNGRKRVIETALSEPEDADGATSDAYSEQDDEHDVKSLHSDALDDDTDLETKKRGGKRKRASHASGKTPRAKGGSPRKRHKNAASDEDEEGEGPELKEGQRVVGKVVQAPKTGLGECSLYYITTISSIGANLNLPPQSLPVKYLKIRLTFFWSSQNQSATTGNGDDASIFVCRYMTDFGDMLGLDYMVRSSESSPCTLKNNPHS